MSKEEVDLRLHGLGLVMPATPAAQSSLHERFGIPPFSVWNTREWWWRNRRNKWLALGIKSEVGRNIISYEQKSLNNLGGVQFKHGTSTFDPTLCELVYRLFAPAGGQVLDPFAGGSVRGIVASVLGLKYWGCDLSKEQIEANHEQITEANTGKYRPKWETGDSFVVVPDRAPVCDFLFSCPPYGGLEVYSKHPKDISNYTYPKFRKRYGGIIAHAGDCLREDRFACFVVGNFRDKKTGIMHDLVGDTCRAFQRAGLGLYNEIVLVNSVGTAGMRTNTSFVRGKRKIVRVHQTILVFVKGSWEKAAEACIKPGEIIVDRGQA